MKAKAHLTCWACDAPIVMDVLVDYGAYEMREYPLPEHEGMVRLDFRAKSLQHGNKLIHIAIGVKDALNKLAYMGRKGEDE